MLGNFSFISFAGIGLLVVAAGVIVFALHQACRKIDQNISEVMSRPHMQ